MTLEIRPEEDQDRKAVWNVNRLAFDAEDEANLVDALRDGGYVEVSLVAEIDGEIVGHILFTRLAINTDVGIVNALSLAPMAVLPSHQRQGIGSQLVEAGLEMSATESQDRRGSRPSRVLSTLWVLCETCTALGVAVWRWRRMDGDGTCARCD